jgi:hypothetical protein
MKTVTWILLLALALPVLAGEIPAALELRFQDAVRYQKTRFGTETGLKDGPRTLHLLVDPDGKPSLVNEPLSVFLSLDTTTGKVLTAVAARDVLNAAQRKPDWSNYAVHPVDATGVQWREGRLTGTLALTVNPDMCVAGGGQQAPAACTIDIDMAPGADATYRGRYGAYGIAGKATCAVATAVDLTQPCETTIMVFNALGWTQGMAASNGVLNISWRDGQVVACTLRHIYHTNIWEAALDAGDLKLREGRLTGRLTAKLTDHCGKFGSGDYAWTIDAVVVERRVLGTAEGTLPDSKKSNSHLPPGAKTAVVTLNGLIATTAAIPDINKWQLDHDVRAKEDARKPPAAPAKTGAVEAAKDGKVQP